MPSYTFVCQILPSVIPVKPSLQAGCRFTIAKEHVDLDCLRPAFGMKLFSNTVKKSDTTSRELYKL